MDSYDSNQILILLDFSRSSRCAILCTAQIAKFELKTRHNFWRFWIIYSKIFIQNSHFSNLKCDFLSKFWWNFVGISRTSSECQEFSISWKKKGSNFRKIREKFGNVQIIQKIIQNYSVVSLGTTGCSAGCAAREFAGACHQGDPAWPGDAKDQIKTK